MGMGKGKQHHRRQEEAAQDHSSLINMDPEGPYRTHLLFPGRKEDEGQDGRGSSVSPSFMKSMFSGAWGKQKQTGLPFGGGGGQAAEMQRYRMTPETDPFYMRGKQVSFEDPQANAYSSSRPERRPNSYHSEPAQGRGAPDQGYYTPYNEPFRENDYASFNGPPGRKSGPGRPAGKACDPYVNGNGPPVDSGMSPTQTIPPRRSNSLMRTDDQGPQPLGAPPRGPPRRRPLSKDGTEVAVRRHDEADAGRTRQNKDCFIIPQGNLERFLPDGITVRKKVI